MLLKIHGVNYTKSDGSALSGVYVPIVVENSPDMMTVAREELGFPSIFSDIGVNYTRGQSLSLPNCPGGAHNGEVYG